jgi:hypothetical protein
VSPAFAIALLALAAPKVHRSAIVLGINEPFDETQAVLRYADDDAARFYEIFEPQMNELQLLTVLDPESQQLFPHVASVAKPATRAELAAALERAFAEGKAAKGRGHRAELYFVYTGHGRLHGGEGQVKLQDGALSRTQLTEMLLASESHDRIHLIVDACNAYHLVAARGEERVTQDLDAEFEKFVEAHALDRYPRVGVVLSTSGAGATHEWSRYRGGVFSHEVRSALTGAADANEDGRVDYEELEAFLAAANLSVPIPKGKPKVFVRPPKIERSAPLLTMERDLPVLTLPGEISGHYYLEDDRGLRYAELNKAGGHPVKLVLIPRARYALMRSDGAEVAAFSEPRGGILLSWPFDVKPPSQAERGGEEPPGAFEEPFGPAFVQGFRARLELEARPPNPLVQTTMTRDALGYSAAGIAVAAASVTAWQSVVAQQRYELYQATWRGPERDRYEEEVRDARTRAIALGVTTGFVEVGSALLFLLWD